MLRALCCMVLLFTIACAQTSPALSFQPVGEQSLIVLNNPEQIFKSDLADKSISNMAVLVMQDMRGEVREWFELFNEAGVTVGFAIVVQNPPEATAPIQVASTRSGWCTDWFEAVPLASMFNTPPTAEYTTLQPGQSMVVMRYDHAVPNATVFSGAVDISIIGAPATIYSLIYVDFEDVDLSTVVYEGYVQRRESNGEEEALCYKGFTPSAVMATTELDFTIDRDLSVPANLTVSYPLFNLTDGAYGAAMTNETWVTNITPSDVPTAVTSDMEGVFTPGWGWIDPTTKSDGTGNYPNFGNWGVELSYSGAVTNNDVASHWMSFNMHAVDGCLSNIAFLEYSGMWSSVGLTTGSFVYLNFTVPAGATVPFNARYILGGSSCGALTNWVTIS